MLTQLRNGGAFATVDNQTFFHCFHLKDISRICSKSQQRSPTTIMITVQQKHISHGNAYHLFIVPMINISSSYYISSI